MIGHCRPNSRSHGECLSDSVRLYTDCFVVDFGSGVAETATDVSCQRLVGQERKGVASLLWFSHSERTTKNKQVYIIKQHLRQIRHLVKLLF